MLFSTLTRFPLRLVLSVGTSFGPTLSAHAQAGEDLRSFRILALGEAPPWREKMVDGVRTQVAPPAAAQPPARLRLLDPASKDQSQAIRLGEISGVYQLRNQENPVVLLDGEKEWAKLKAPRSSQALLLCWRQHGAKNWSKVKTRFLPDTREAFPAQKLRLVNVSDRAATVILDRKKSIIAPGKGKLFDLGATSSRLLVTVPHPTKNQTSRLLDTRLQAGAHERVNVILYKSDSARPRHPARAWLRKETLPDQP